MLNHITCELPYLQELPIIQVLPYILHNPGSCHKDTPDVVVVHNTIQISLPIPSFLQKHDEQTVRAVQL